MQDADSTLERGNWVACYRIRDTILHAARTTIARTHDSKILTRVVVLVDG